MAQKIAITTLNSISSIKEGKNSLTVVRIFHVRGMLGVEAMLWHHEMQQDLAHH